ncbi:UDP-N-acetylmuramoyl-tripeptide--D-alanyl-D-alanine ligase [Limosilactobacillus equigenerosi]|nr:UDP-N-acetylmuramoyl-tripeptide--D-alanyl-D-alanine ligase [Limosilactobacillus equigenerosi]
MKMTLAAIATALQIPVATPEWEQIIITDVAFDTRQLTAGSLFVPLTGARDGHDFIDAAIENGAQATLWQRGHAGVPTTLPVLEVADPLEAMQTIAKAYLAQVKPQVVAVTGSNGKTTTKDLIAAVLATKFKVTKTPENFNNELGVPLTIFGMDDGTEVLVVEMGMDRFGQLEQLSQLVHPDFAVITMIGEAHIEFFGTRDKIADAKMEIVAGMPATGTLVINGDEPLLTSRAATLSQTVKQFGRQATNDVYATQVTVQPTQLSFTTNTWPELTMTVPLVGEYNVSNALAAVTIGQAFQISGEQIAHGLATSAMTANRSEWLTAPNGTRILSDVYNSNPTAAREVLQTVSQLPTAGNRIAVLGDMLELGTASAALHASLATAIDPIKFHAIYLVGDEMRALQAQLQTNGYPMERVHWYAKDDLASLTQELQSVLQADDMVVLKASHGIHLETVLANLTTPE